MKLTNENLETIYNALRHAKHGTPEHDTRQVIGEEIVRRYQYDADVIAARARVNRLIKEHSTDYAGVMVWNGISNTLPAYKVQQLHRARADSAPFNATYCRDGHGQDGQWSTIDNVTALETLERLEQRLIEVGAV